MVSDILYVVFLVNIVFAGFFVFYNFFFFIGYLVFRLFERGKESGSYTDGGWNRFAIIVPAHNEELLLGKLIDSAENIDYPKEKYELIIIADNCSDCTAEIAKKRGVKCYERQDLTQRGKPYAIKWLLEQIDLDIYDAFTVVDADTVIDRNYLKGMNQKLKSGVEAIQGYFGVMNPDDTWLTRIAFLPGIIKFKMRYFCKERLGLSCPLMGNGMCFSQSIIKKYGWNAFSVTENWEYYIRLTINGHVVHYAEDSVIYSHMVQALSHGITQRKRWLKGQLNVLLDFYKPLLKKALGDRDFVALDSLIELCLPSYSMLLNWTICLLAATGLSWLLGGHSIWLFICTTGLILAQGIYLLAALIIGRPSFKTCLSLFGIPLFLVWKMGVTLIGIFNLKNREWEKTERRIKR